MGPRVSHRFIAEVQVEGGASLDTAALRIDWTPAVEWAHLRSIRDGDAPLDSPPGPVCIEPRWDARGGPPYVVSLAISPEGAGAQSAEEIPLQYLAEAVRQEVASLVEAGRIAEGATYTWRICAFEVEAKRAAPPVLDRFTVDDVGAGEERLGVSVLSERLRDASHFGPSGDAAAALDVPVLFARSVLDEAAASATAASELEAGGILLGRLSRNAESGDLVVEVSAQVPAKEAIAEDASLRFTPQTWQAVHAALCLRGEGERIVGWWHSHPRKVWPCHDCPPERRARCPSNRPFFSTMDVSVHRAAFQGPLNVALLLSFHDEPAPRHDLFGWRRGVIVPRDYYVLEGGK